MKRNVNTIFGTLCFIVLLLSVSVSCDKATAGRGRIEGTVSHVSNGEPVQGVTVSYGNIKVETDFLGYYLLDTIPDGPQGIQFSKMGYGSVVCKVNVPRDGTVINDVQMDVMYSAWAVGGTEEHYGTIFHTDNGGIVWKRQGDVHSIPDDVLYGVCAVDNNVCWVVGDSTLNVKTSKYEYLILKTRDGGETWQRQGTAISSVSPTALLAVTAVDTSYAWAASNDKYLFMTKDGGNSWTKCYEADAIQSFSCISTTNGTEIWAAGNPDMEKRGVYVAYSADKGATWEEKQVSVLSQSDTIYSIRVVDRWAVFLTGTFGIAMSMDNGANWKIIQPTSHIVTSLCILSSIYSWYTDGADIKYSFNGLQDVETAKLNVEQQDRMFTGISFAGDGDVGAATYITPDYGREGGLLVSYDSGQNWTMMILPYKVALFSVSYAGSLH